MESFNFDAFQEDILEGGSSYTPEGSLAASLRLTITGPVFSLYTPTIAFPPFSTERLLKIRRQISKLWWTSFRNQSPSILKQTGFNQTQQRQVFWQEIESASGFGCSHLFGSLARGAELTAGSGALWSGLFLLENTYPICYHKRYNGRITSRDLVFPM